MEHYQDFATTRIDEPMGETRADGLRRLSKLTWRATQLSALATVGFVTLFVRSAPAQTVSNQAKTTPTVKATTASPSPSPSPTKKKKKKHHKPRPVSAAPSSGGGGAPPPLRDPPNNRPGSPAAGPGARAGADHLQRLARRMIGTADAVHGRTFRALGTFASVLVTVPATLEAAGTALAAELTEIDRACSRFRADSELTRVNQAAGQPVMVSQLFTDALAAALAAARLTGGDVDPTCGRALTALGYDTDFAQARRRTGPLTETASPAPGWQVVELDTERRVVRLPAGVWLDLGATAKALAADRAATRIAAALGCGVLINLGGDISVAGPPPAGGWRVGIADDVDFGGVIPAVPPGQAICLSDGGLATSSTLVRSWRRGGEDLHHIIAPRTGQPARSCWRTVSVAAATCLDANTASTAAIIRGEQAPAWLAGLRLPARLVRHDGSVAVTGGWPADPPPATVTPLFGARA